MAQQMPFYGTIPNIAQAYQNDPRTKLAQSAMALGTSTAPVAQGGWAVTDGLARAAQAIAGAFMTKAQDKKFGQREQQYVSDMANAAGMASAAQPSMPAAVNPAPVNPGMGAAASALGGMPAPMQTVDPNLAISGGAGANAMASGSPAPSVGARPSPGLPAPSTTPASSGLSPLDLYRRGIRPIEGGTDPKTGAFRTSPKGAVGPGQVMPGTGPEAAALAGLPWDEKRFRSDTQYNDALGAAYYAKQFKDFGDPVIAAAAYNAGPGRVRRALRRAGGGDYTQFLPQETKDYVVNFASATGLDGGFDARDGVSTGSGFTPNPSAGVVAPQMEAVPERAPAPSAVAPAAPQRPAEVATNRIPMAQALLASGNPDLMAIAQTYLDKGLDEQNAARTLASQQEFAQGQTGYGANLADWQNARSDNRQAQNLAARDAEGRNFDRESRYSSQQFQAGQAAEDRGFRTSEREATQRYGTSEREASQAYGTSERIGTQEFTASENAKNRENRVDVATQRSQQRNAYLNSPTGIKAREKAGTEIDGNNVAISKYERFLDLNAKESTGGATGMALATPGIGSLYAFGNSNLAELETLSKDTTLANLGGSLGTAISDGDRKFISEANVSTRNPYTTNKNIARARIGALRRKNDYLQEQVMAEAEGRGSEFVREWSQFAKSTPIVQYDARGNAQAVDKPLTFSEWRASRPKYDANGKKVN